MPIPHDFRAETRRLFALAWPVVLTSLNWTILHLTDIIVVGLVSTQEVAALGASRTLTFIGIVVVLGAVSGILVETSRADGAGDAAETGRVLHRGLALGGALGLLCCAILFLFAQPLLLLLGVAPELAPAAARVVQAMAFAYPFQLVIVSVSYFLEGVSRPRRVAVVNLAILPLNALLAWALSGGHLGLPLLGAVGAALATVIASAIGAVGMLAAAWTLPDAVARGIHRLGEAPARVAAGAGALLRFGAVPGLAAGLELAGFSILIAISTQLGEAETHAFQIVFSIHNITFAFAIGLGSAAGVRAGNAIGEGRPEAAGARAAIAAGIAAAAMAVLALFLVLAPGAVVALFPATTAVQALALVMLPLWAPFILFDGIQVVCVYALRSMGDQVVAGINSILAYFVLTGGLGLALFHAGWGIYALVFASGLGMLAAALLHGARLWRVSRRSGRRS